MGASYKTIKNGFPKTVKELEAAAGISVEAGVLKGENAWLASIHEYGCNIPVTPKMRAWLHHQGVHLKKNTTHIVIPERPFLRPGYDQNRDAVLKKASSLLADVAAGSMSADQLANAVGLELSSAIRDYAVELSSPPNSSFTTDRKGSSNPLVDSGDMIGGIDYRVVRK